MQAQLIIIVNPYTNIKLTSCANIGDQAKFETSTLSTPSGNDRFLTAKSPNPVDEAKSVAQGAGFDQDKEKKHCK